MSLWKPPARGGLVEHRWMPRQPKPLPPELSGAFTVHRALSLGIPPARLHRSDLYAPYNGVRMPATSAVAAGLLDACHIYLPRLRPWQFYSHDAALLAIGVPMPEWPFRPRLHVSTHRPAREPRTHGVVGHRLQRREPATLTTSTGLRIEHPVRAWRQVGTTWRLDDLIAAGEFLVSGDSPLASIDELRAEVEVMGDMRHGILRRALGEMRVGSRSPRETHFRLALVRAGLPEPEINWTLRSELGAFVAELDLAYPKWRVAPEYDGRVHAEDAAQFARDADRWDRIRAEGWDHVRILNHHMTGGGATAIRKVRDALHRAGWQGG